MQSPTFLSEAVQVPGNGCVTAVRSWTYLPLQSLTQRWGKSQNQEAPPSPLMWPSGSPGLAVLRLWAIRSLSGQLWIYLYISARLEDPNPPPGSPALGIQLKRRCICCHFHLLSLDPGQQQAVLIHLSPGLALAAIQAGSQGTVLVKNRCLKIAFSRS